MDTRYCSKNNRRNLIVVGVLIVKGCLYKRNKFNCDMQVDFDSISVETVSRAYNS